MTALLMSERGVVEGTVAVPLHPGGFAWSGQQDHILRTVETALLTGDLRVLRFVIEAVAGSGKTTLLEAILLLIARLRPDLRTAATAFNTHIALLLKEILTRLQDAGFNGAQIIGGSNGVQAAGRALLVQEASVRGFSSPAFEQKSCRWTRLSFMRAYSWLVNDREGWTERNMAQKANAVVASTAAAALKHSGLTGPERQDHPLGRKPHTVFKAVQTGLSKAVEQALCYGLTGTDHDGSLDDLRGTLLPLDALKDNHALTFFGEDVLIGLVNDVLNRGQATTWVPERLYPEMDDAARALHKGHGDYLVGSAWGAFDKVWLATDSRTQRPLYGKDKAMQRGAVSKENLVSIAFPKEKGGGTSSTLKVDLDDGKKVGIGRSGDTLRVIFGGAQTSGRKHEAWGKEPVRNYLKGGRRRGKGAWTFNEANDGAWVVWASKRTSSTSQNRSLDDVEQALRAGFKASEIQDLDGEEEITVLQGLTLSMKDMTWGPLAFDLHLPDEDCFDIMLVDEVQDLSVSQGDLLRRVTKNDGGWVLVGDGKQAIYGWAGAVAGSLKANADAVQAQALPMTVSWRNSQNVAQAARMVSEAMADTFRAAYPEHTALLEDFSLHRASDFAPEGGCSYAVGLDDVAGALAMIRGQRPGSTQAVIGRTNGSLAPHIKAALTQGIPVSVAGGSDGFVKDIETLLTTVRVTKYTPAAQSRHGCGFKHKPAVTFTAASAMQTLDGVQQTSMEVSLKQNGNAPAAAAADGDYRDRALLIELLRVIVGLWGEQNPGAETTTADLMKWVTENLFKVVETKEDDEPVVIDNDAVHFSTVHRIKGAEADFAFIIEEEIVENDDGKNSVRPLFPLKRTWEAGPVSAAQECNVAYVAWTRAKVMTTPVRAEAHFDGDMVWWWEASMDEDVQNVPESDSEAADAPEAPDTPEEPEAAPEAVPEAPMEEQVAAWLKEVGA